MDAFGKYAARLLDFEVRRLVVGQPDLYPKQAIPIVVAELRPSQDATLPGEVISMNETIEEFQRRGGSGLTPGELMVVPAVGTWEQLIEMTWGQSTAGATIAPPRHPFEFALRNRFNSGTFVQRLGPFLDAAVQDLEIEFPPDTQSPQQKQQTPNRAPRGRTKPGPKPNKETARKVFDIVQTAASGTLWKTKLDDICEALDETQIPCPKTWSTRDPALLNWLDAAVSAPELAKKAISHRLKNAQN